MEDYTQSTAKFLEEKDNPNQTIANEITQQRDQNPILLFSFNNQVF